MQLDMPHAHYFSSTYPPIAHLPEVSTWDFLFLKEGTEDQNKDIYLDAITGESLKYGELLHLTKALAYAFIHKLGLQMGDRVVLFSRNSLYFPAIVLATQAAGLVCSPANCLFRSSELAYQIKDCGAKFVIAGPDQLGIASVACNECGISPPLLSEKVKGAHARHSSIWDFVDGNELEPEPLSPDEAKERTSIMCYSSGTSGRPKGVKTTHYNMTSAILQAMAMTPSSFSPDEVCIATLPLSHVYALFVHIFAACYTRAKVVVLPQFDLVCLLSTIERYHATTCHIVPPIAVKLTRDERRGDFDVSSLREWRSGAAPLGLELTNILEAEWAVPVHAHYGMTETTAVIALTDRGGSEAPFPAVGHLAPNMEGKVQDGELCLKGPNIMLGYHNRPDADGEAFDDEGYMHTGDLVRVDDDGFVYVVDRTKEVIKFNGYQVAPAGDLQHHFTRHGIG
ncbi:hypothetical protein OF83DRAFT_933769 [Amylostereum chailletii]|nr:hypothetical protein OF83DRAFT_933769 [Amylostereum chailletii]